MSLRKSVDRVLEKIDHSKFESVEGGLEKILNLLESQADNSDPKDVEYAVSQAEVLREECKTLLRSEKESIIKTAKANGISLAELGIDENDDFDSDSEEEEEDLNKNKKKTSRSQNDSSSKCCILI